MEDNVLEVFKKEYEDISHMLDWHGEDGSYARTVDAVVKRLLTNLGYNLNDIEWLK